MRVRTLPTTFPHCLVLIHTHNLDARLSRLAAVIALISFPGCVCPRVSGVTSEVKGDAGAGEVELSEAGEAVVDEMQSEHLSFEAAMKNTEQTITDMTDPTQAVTEADVSESVTDVLQPGGGDGGGGDGFGDSAGNDGSEFAAASKEEQGSR